MYLDFLRRFLIRPIFEYVSVFLFTVTAIIMVGIVGFITLPIYIGAFILFPLEYFIYLPMFIFPYVHFKMFPESIVSVRPAISGIIGTLFVYKFSPLASMPAEVLLILCLIPLIFNHVVTNRSFMALKGKKIKHKQKFNYKVAFKLQFLVVFIIGFMFFYMYVLDSVVISLKKDCFKKDINSTFVVESSNKFAFKMYKQLKTDDKNLVFSNFVLYNALVFLYAGASENTKQEIKDVLSLDIDVDKLIPAASNLQEEILLSNTGFSKRIQIKIANSLWIQKGYPIRKPYLDLIKADFGNVFHYVDFKNQQDSLNKINSWVGKHIPAHYDIKLKKDQLAEAITLIIVNTIYFKGKWLHEFDSKHTDKGTFHITKKDTITVDMMKTTETITFNYFGCEWEKIHVLELPYKDDSISMIIFLPTEDSTLKEFEDRVNYETYNRYIKGLYTNSMYLDMPKFKFKSKLKFKEALKSLGMVDSFKWPEADFSEMDARKFNKDDIYSLYLQDIFQMSEIEVNEEGTEAVAVNFSLSVLGGALSPQHLRINRPFMYIIKHNHTNQILFMGRVYNPSEDGNSFMVH